MSKLNIVYMHSHDTGRYVQPYGHAVRTPRLQQFAEQGVLFRQAYCANPTCSPSRAALLTGQWAHSSGMLGLAHRGFRLNDMGHHLVHTLKAAGYHTALAGVQHVAAKDEQVGYDRLLGLRGQTAASIAFLREKHDRPFFLDLGFWETHRPFPEPAAEDDPRFTLPPAPLPDTPDVRRDMACFKTMANDLDTRIGSVLDVLDETGLADNTLVIVTTDHGPAFPAMKSRLTDHGIAVMLMMRGPATGGGAFTGGQCIDSLVSQVDLFPTICESVGIDPPPWLQGVSLMPLVRGEREAVRDEVFAETNFHAAYEPMRAIRTARYKYIRRYGQRQTPVLPNCDDSESKTCWLEHGWADRPDPHEQLYDLMFDPTESNNIVDRPELTHVCKRMRDRLEQWMRDTNDPILDGPLPVPAGAQLNPADQRSAGEEAEHFAVSRPAE